jgi:thiol-disulfide isomerase/thioredoxin
MAHRRLLVFAAAGMLFAGAPLSAADPAPDGAVVAPASAAPLAGADAPEAKPKAKSHHKRYSVSDDAAPNFSLTDVRTGKLFNLRDHVGEVVLIDFWATWCGPCRMVIPHLIQAQKDYKGRGFTVVGVSLDQRGGADLVANFARQFKLNYPVVNDADAAVAMEYGGIRSIPSTLVLDRHQHVVGGFVGYHGYGDYQNLIDKALSAD